MSEVTLNFVDPNTREAARYAAQAAAVEVNVSAMVSQAEDAALQSAASAATAQSAALLSDNIYVNTTAGLAATSEGGFFWTANPAKLWRDVSGVAVEQDALATTASIRAGVNTQRLDVVLANSPTIQPEIHLTGINSSWIAGAIDIVWNLRKGTNYVSLATVNKVTGEVNDLWMTAHRGFAVTTTTASSSGTTVTLSSTTNIEVGMQISTAAMRAGGSPTVWPKVTAINSSTQVTLDTALTLASGVQVVFGDNPTFGFGLTPPNLFTYRSQFAAPDNEPTMGCVGIRLGQTQDAYAFAFFDSNNAHVWGWRVNNSQVYADGIRIRDRSTPGALLEFSKNDYNVVYQLSYSGDNLKFTYASSSIEIWEIEPSTGRMLFDQPVCTPVYDTVASLPSPSRAGMRAFVLDSSVAASGNFGAIVAGGGSHFVPVWSDSGNWRIG